jgi:anti-sigma28 factor (negative regulator of flagellin synthesis)
MIGDGTQNFINVGWWQLMMLSSQQVDNILQLYFMSAGTKMTMTMKTGKPSRTESINMSGMTHEMRMLREEVMKSPDIRIDKIFNLRQRIRDNAYEVAGDEIASKMIGRSLVDRFVIR